MAARLTLEAMIVGTIILNSTREFHDSAKILMSTSSFPTISSPSISEEIPHATDLHEPLVMQHLHQGNLCHFSGITQAPTKLCYTCVTTRTTRIPWSKLIKDLLDNQFIWKRLQDLAASMQFYHQCFISCLQRFFRITLIRNDAK